MSPIKRVIGALVNRSPAELADRVTQIARAKLEVVGLGDPPRADPKALLDRLARGGVSGAPELLDRFRARVSQGPFEAFHDLEATVRAALEHWPDDREDVTAQANAVSAGRFPLLGYDALDFGTPIDWSLDPVNGLRADSVHWSKVPYLDPSQVGDHKIVWELNRHQYFVRLGQAYVLTGDKRWAELFVAHASAWMETNPPKIGINWTSSLEVAFRAISWIWALHFFRDSPALTPEFFARLVAHLRAHGRHVEQYISTSFSPNTHLTGEALGLVYLGTFLPELEEATRWRRRGREWLMGATDFQILDDGGYFEHSLHYHRYTVDFYVHLWLLSVGSEEGVDPRLAPLLERMTEHLVSVTRADGSLALVGDDDGGKFVFLDSRPVFDARSAISSAALLLEREDWLELAGTPSAELLWLFGPSRVARVTATSEEDVAWPPSTSHPDVGLHVMRGGSSDSGEDFAVIRCGPPAGLSGGHSHADQLALDLTLDGIPLLVDPGTASYMDQRNREWFRSTAAHNTLSADGRSSYEPKGPFGWSDRPPGVLDDFARLGVIDYFSGRLNWPASGDTPNRNGLEHHRAVMYVRDAYWVVLDRWRSAAEPESVRLNFQFAPGLRTVGRGAVVEVSDASSADVARVTALTPGTWSEAEGRVAPVYGHIEAAPRWVFAPTDVERKGGWSTAITIVGRPSLTCGPVDAESGQLWSVEGLDGGTRDLVGCHGPASEAESLDTDGALVWIRRGSADHHGHTSAAFAAGATRLALDGAAALNLGRPSRYFCVFLDPETREFIASSAPTGPTNGDQTTASILAWARAWQH